MCVTNSSALNARMKIIRNQGLHPEKKYWHEIIGSNFRMTNLQAAIGVAQMERIDEFIRKKIKISEWYKAEIKRQKVDATFQIVPKKVTSVWWMFTIVFKNKINRDRLMAELLKFRVHSRPLFYPLSQMPAFKKLRKSKNLKISHSLGERGITLPTNLKLSRQDIKFIVSKLIIALNKAK